MIELDAATTGSLVVTIFDQTGEMVKVVEAVLPGDDERQIPLDISDLAPGLYIYEVMLGNQIIDKDRFVKR